MCEGRWRGGVESEGGIVLCQSGIWSSSLSTSFCPRCACVSDTVSIPSSVLPFQLCAITVFLSPHLCLRRILKSSSSFRIFTPSFHLSIYPSLDASLILVNDWIWKVLSLCLSLAPSLLSPRMIFDWSTAIIILSDFYTHPSHSFLKSSHLWFYPFILDVSSSSPGSTEAGH